VVAQERQPLYVVMSDGRIQNTYEIKLNNRVTKPITFHINLEGLPGAELDLGGLDKITLRPEERLRVLARVRVLPQGEQSGQQYFNFIVTPLMATESNPVKRHSVFYLPG
jgi:polyferredoxin